MLTNSGLRITMLGRKDDASDCRLISKFPSFASGLKVTERRQNGREEGKGG